MPDASVLLGRHDREAFLPPAVKTTPDGAFEIRQVPPGEYYFQLHATRENNELSMCTFRTPFTLAPGQKLTGIELVLAGAELSVEGHVWDAQGNPLSGVLVMSEDASTGEDFGRTETNGEGWYSVQGLHARQVSLSFHPKESEAARFGSTRIQAVDVGTTDADVVLPEAGTLLGFVRDAATGEAVNDFSVTIADIELSPGAHTDFYGTQTEKDKNEGTFLTTGLSPGVVTLQLSAKGYATRTVNDIRVVGEQTTEHEFLLWPAGTLEGIITFQGDLATQESRAYVRLVPTEEGVGDGERCDRMGGSAGADGRYACTVPAGTYTVVALACLGQQQLHQYAEARVHAGMVTHLDFHFGRGTGELAGHLTMPQGFKRADVYLRDGSLQEPLTKEVSSGTDILALTQCAEDGSYTIIGLPPGTYNATAVARRAKGWAADNIRQTSQTVVIATGRTARLDLAP